MTEVNDTWIQVIMSAATGLVGAVVGILTAAWRGQRKKDNEFFQLELRTERARNELELRLKKEIDDTRHALQNYIQGIAVAPIERTESRIGALEQDVAVLKDRKIFHRRDQ